MKDDIVYRWMIYPVSVIIVLSILSAGIVNADIKNVHRNLDGAVDISVSFLGIEGFKNITLRIPREKYDDLERIFNDTLKNLERVKTDEEACMVFNETITKLKNHGLLPGIDAKKLQEEITGKYLASRKFADLFSRAGGKESIVDTIDNMFCLICGESNLTYCMDILTRIYDLTIRIPFFTIIFSVIILTGLIHNIYMDLTCMVQNVIPKSSNNGSIADVIIKAMLFCPRNPLPISAALYFGAEDAYEEEYRYPAYGHVWTKGVKGIKEWNGTFYGDINPYWCYYPFYPLLSYTIFLAYSMKPYYKDIVEIISSIISVVGLPIFVLYGILEMWLPLIWLPGAVGYYGIFIHPLNYTTSYSYFLGYAHAVSIKTV